MTDAIAYFITFTCYGTWLHGKEIGSVDPEHNQPGTPFLPQDEERRQTEIERMKDAPYQLDAPRRALVFAQFARSAPIGDGT